MANLSKEQITTLEQFVDSSSLATVLDALSTIAFEKAEHIHTNWQDRALARAWESAGQKLALASINKSIQTVSRNGAQDNQSTWA